MNTNLLKIKENKITAKIRMFFVHCLGLQDLNKERAIILVLKLGFIFSNIRNKLCLLRNYIKVLWNLIPENFS